MKALPIVSHFFPDPDASLMRTMERLRTRLVRERPELLGSHEARRLQVTQLDDVPTLHLNDQSDTTLLYGGYQIHYRQDLARLRAGDCDLVAACSAPVEGYESYCRDYLGLGTVEWLCPQARNDPTHLAIALWRDTATRARLLAASDEGPLLIDPYQGNASVWELAALLDDERPGQIRIVAPPPQVTAWVNHKARFTELVCELYGESFVPCTRSASNLAMAAEAIRELAPQTSKLILKLPDSAGGGGNLILDSHRFRERTLSDIHAALQDELREHTWDGTSELLLSVWEPDVQEAPSVQIWIPPGEEPPVVEGLFEQFIGDDRGTFVGARLAQMETELTREIVDRSWVMARLFQQLGYVGRCSFDLLLVTEKTGQVQPKFLECNGRWGGVSMPMSLMNRLFGNLTRQPFVIRNYDRLGLQQVSFPRLLEAMADELFEVGSGRGKLILINPAKMHARGGIGAIVLGPTSEEAEDAADGAIPKRLQEMAGTGS